MLKLVMTREQLRGEILRACFTREGLSARDVATKLGLYEANISATLKSGQCYSKHEPALLFHACLNKVQLMVLQRKVEKAIVDAGVEIVTEYSELSHLPGVFPLRQYLFFHFPRIFVVRFHRGIHRLRLRLW